jgi:RNA 2',3'-cyclic 3'-phosphodiesterase
MKRLSIGIPIESPMSVQQVELWKKDACLNRNVLNWTIPGNWHITLFFLGSTEESAVSVLQQLIEESFRNVQVYQTELKGVGVFPNTNNPKVLWLGLADLQPILSAYSQLGELLQQNGFSYDQKPLKPHLTLARVKRANHPSEFQSLLDKYQETVFDRIEIQSVALFESISKSEGPVYKPLYVKKTGLITRIH